MARTSKDLPQRVEVVRRPDQVVERHYHCEHDLRGPLKIERITEQVLPPCWHAVTSVIFPLDVDGEPTPVATVVLDPIGVYFELCDVRTKDGSTSKAWKRLPSWKVQEMGPFSIETEWVFGEKVVRELVVETVTRPCDLDPKKAANGGGRGACRSWVRKKHHCKVDREDRREGYYGPQRRDARDALRAAATEFNSIGEAISEPDSRQLSRGPWRGGYWD